EAVFGAGQGVDLVVYHTISTGVGGVKIESGKIDTSSVGFEPGHQVLDIDRTILGENIQPTLENLVSGRAVEERMGVKPYEIDQADVVWDELAGYLAQGLRNTVLYWSPDMIILGGSMMVGDPKIPLDSVRRATVAVLDGVMPCPFITTAALGDEAGLHGALAFLQQKVKNDL
ncbi:MAG: ROK family protein, partial [Candidatus Pacebacteria bacterium]|nr:ROK family protein [Candidatus Paceibacterota bacterium]